MRVIALLCAALAVTLPAHAKVTRYLTGDAADVSPALAGPALNLGGGGTDVDAALQQMIDLARGCAACATTLDVVILRAGGSNGYNDYIYAMNGVDSVESVVVSKREDAMTVALADTVRKAEVVFFAGGDQCDYVELFKGTPVEAAVEAVHARGGAIGGTSAGMAIQGEFVYDACRASATSADILANPYHRSATFTTGFFNWTFMADTLTDQHFVTRDRMGRLLGFLARQLQDGVATSALGVAADEETSIVVDNQGIATVFGNGDAYFVLADHVPAADERVQPRQPLTYHGYKIWKAGPGETFDLRRRPTRDFQSISVIGGVLSAYPY